jgi:hypothetical protein
MSDFERTVYESPEFLVTLTHDSGDPAVWIVRTWRKALLGRRCVESRWFNVSSQANAYAEAVARERDRGAAQHA